MSKGTPVGLSAAEMNFKPSGEMSPAMLLSVEARLVVLRMYCTNLGLAGLVIWYIMMPLERSKPMKA